jgi:hypothetical protein
LGIHLADSSSLKTYYHYSLGITADQSGSSRLAYERVRRSGELILDRTDEKDDLDPLLLGKSCLEHTNCNSSIIEIAEFLGSIRYLNFIPELFRCQDPFSSTDVPSDPFGRKILQRVAALPAAERDKKIKIIEDILRIAVPQMPKLRFSVSRSGVPRLEGTFDIGRPRVKHLQDRLSDGTLAAFAILWSFLEEGSLLLLEKPETAIHHGTIPPHELHHVHDLQ